MKLFKSKKAKKVKPYAYYNSIDYWEQIEGIAPKVNNRTTSELMRIYWSRYGE